MAAMLSRSPVYLHGLVEMVGCVLFVCVGVKKVFAGPRFEPECLMCARGNRSCPA